MKKKIFILVSLLVLLGIGVYVFIDYQKKMQEEQEQEVVKAVEEAISRLYVDEERAEFVQDISKEDFEEIRGKISKVTNDKSAKRFSKDIDDAEVLLNAQEEVQSLLEEGILVETIDETQITSLTALITEVKEINQAFAELLNKDVEEIKSQYESLLRAKAEVYALFEDDERKTINKEVTRTQYEEAKSMLATLVNEKEKNELQELLEQVDAELTKNEEAEKKRIEAEKKMAALTVGKAKAIGTEVLDEFTAILRKAGSDNNWGLESTGVYAVVKPLLLEVVTKRYADTLSDYVEDYYCECDSGWNPFLSDELIRYEIISKTEDTFTISAIELVNEFLVGPAFKLIYTFQNENGVWKLDGWKVESLEGKNLVLTAAEIGNSMWSYYGEMMSYGKMTAVRETYSEEIGEAVVQVQFETGSIYISKKSGDILNIE